MSKTQQMLALIILVAAGISIPLALISKPQPKPQLTVSQLTSIFNGIPQNGDSIGSPQAPIVVVEYADFQCPQCRRFETDKLPEVVKGPVKSGQVQMILVPISILGPQSKLAAAAAYAAAQQSLMWPYAASMYAGQQAENSGYINQAFLRKAALAVPGLDADKLITDLPEAKKIAATAQIKAVGSGINSTPSFAVGKRGSNLRVVDQDHLAEVISQLSR